MPDDEAVTENDESAREFETGEADKNAVERNNTAVDSAQTDGPKAPIESSPEDVTKPLLEEPSIEITPAKAPPSPAVPPAEEEEDLDDGLY